MKDHAALVNGFSRYCFFSNVIRSLNSTITGTEIMSDFYKASSQVMESLIIIGRVVQI